MSKEYDKAWNQFLAEMGEDTPEFEVEFASAWRLCKEQVLNILKQDLQNLDLSTDNCDSRYIEKIKKL